MRGCDRHLVPVKWAVPYLRNLTLFTHQWAGYRPETLAFGAPDAFVRVVATRGGGWAAALDETRAAMLHARGAA
jgi:hypothetical protein